MTPKDAPDMSMAEANDALTAPGQMFEMEEVDIRGVPTRVWKHAPPSLRAIIDMSLPTATPPSSSTRTSGPPSPSTTASPARWPTGCARSSAWPRATGSPSSCATCPNG